MRVLQSEMERPRGCNISPCAPGSASKRSSRSCQNQYKPGACSDLPSKIASQSLSSSAIERGCKSELVLSRSRMEPLGGNTTTGRCGLNHRFSRQSCERAGSFEHLKLRWVAEVERERIGIRDWFRSTRGGEWPPLDWPQMWCVIIATAEGTSQAWPHGLQIAPVFVEPEPADLGSLRGAPLISHAQIQWLWTQTTPGPTFPPTQEGQNVEGSVVGGPSTDLTAGCRAKIETLIHEDAVCKIELAQEHALNEIARSHGNTRSPTLHISHWWRGGGDGGEGDC